jgi:hypothetical protein
MVMKENLEVNVSGGRTSAFMAHWLLENCADRFNMRFVFANTSAEHPDTYRFLRAVDEHLLGGRLILLEAQVHHGERRSSTYCEVTHDTLATDGSVYEEVIKKYGVPNTNTPHCTREMKFRTINSYSQDLWEKNFKRAIGIRMDERRRAKAGDIQYIYPLIDMRPTDKPEILDWFKQFDWDLKIPEYLGNCVTCFKKSKAKLNAVWWDDPKHFDWPARMEREYGYIRPPQDPATYPKNFYRDRKTATLLVKEFAHLNNDNRARWRAQEDEDGACSESCEPFPMEN